MRILASVSLSVLFFSIPHLARATGIEVNNIHFLPSNAIESDPTKFEYYYTLSPLKDFNSPEVLDSVRSLDIDHNLNSPEEKNVWIQIVKVAYRTHHPVSYFTVTKACDFNYLTKLYRDLTINKIDECKFRIDPFFPAPGLNMDLHPYLNTSSVMAPRAFLSLERALGTPTFTLTQYGHHFSKVMFNRTVKSTFTVIQYYATSNPNETQVVSYSLSFIYNIPPSFLGGEGIVKSKLLEQIGKLVERTNSIQD